MVAPSIQNVAGYKELMNYIDSSTDGVRKITVQNVTGGTLTKGMAVYISGSSGLVPRVAAARANALTTSDCFGVLTSDILTSAFGVCQFSGQIDYIDTSAYAAGDKLYVSAATAGLLTTTAPVHPNTNQLVAIVLASSATVGSLFVVGNKDLHGVEEGTILNYFKIGAGTAGAKVLHFINAFIAQLSWEPTAARVLTLPDRTDTLIGKATIDILTNKTYDTAGAGNVFKINTVQITDKTGTGKMVLDTAPTFPTTVTVTGAFGCNGAAAQTAYTLPADATDPATNMALTNALKALVIANGTGQ